MVMDLGLKSDLNMHRAHGGSFRVRIEARQRVVAAANFQKAVHRSDQRTSCHRAIGIVKSGVVGRATCTLLTRLEWPAAARNLISPFSVSPSGGKPGREGSSHAGSTLLASKRRWQAPMLAGSPHKRGCRPLVYPPLALGTFRT